MEGIPTKNHILIAFLLVMNILKFDHNIGRNPGISHILPLSNNRGLSG